MRTRIDELQAQEQEAMSMQKKQQEVCQQISKNKKNTRRSEETRNTDKQRVNDSAEVGKQQH